MERAAGLVLAAGALELHAAADHLDDVGPGDQLVDEVRGDAAGHGESVCEWRVGDSGGAVATPQARRRAASRASRRGYSRAGVRRSFRVWSWRAKQTCAPGPDPKRPLDRPRLSESDKGDIHRFLRAGNGECPLYRPRTAHAALPDPASPSRQRCAMPQPNRSAPRQPAASSRSRRPVRLRAPCDGLGGIGDSPRVRRTVPNPARSVAQARCKEVGFGCRLDEHVFFASRDGTRNPPLHPLRATGGTTKIEGRKPANAGTRPPSARREAGQPLSAALMLALTAPMSARPAAFAFTAPMTLPMSFMDVAPVVAMASLMRASTSAAESCVGR